MEVLMRRTPSFQARMNTWRSSQGRGPLVGFEYRNQTESDPFAIYIYDFIGLFGVEAVQVRDALAEADGLDEISVHINSPGGDVFEGIAIHNLLAQWPGNVNVIVDGIAASIASVIAQAGNRVEMATGSMMMVHEASGLTMGTAGDHRQVADALEKMTGNIAGIYAESTARPVDEWLEAMSAETWYTAQEAVDAKLATGVLRGTKAVENKWPLAAMYRNYAPGAPAPITPETPETDDEPAIDPDFQAQTLALAAARMRTVE